jgi:choline dehydrogenase-like flavoprotein
LLLASAGKAHPQGIGNQNDRVGRNLMETIFTILTVEADRPLQSWKGQPIDARIWDFNQPDSTEGRNGFVLGVSSSMTGQVGPLSYLRRIGGSGKAHKNAMRGSFGRIVNLFGIAEHDADENNRLTLGDDTDEAGMPKVKVYSDYGELDRNTLRAMQKRLFTLADACKAAKVKSLYSTYDRPNASHMAGTCMMGNDPRYSVVDAKGKVHGIGNLYIADASILPGQGMGDSPSLTIQSLALMIAEGMV